MNLKVSRCGELTKHYNLLIKQKTMSGGDSSILSLKKSRWRLADASNFGCIKIKRQRVVRTGPLPMLERIRTLTHFLLKV